MVKNKIKQCVIGLLTSTVNVLNYTKYVLLSNQQNMTGRTLINLYDNEFTQELQYYPFAVNLDRRVRSCYILYGLSHSVCVPNVTESLHLIFNMITAINELKTLNKHILCKSKCKFDGRKCN